jgi:hypothetical protein
MKPKRHSDAVNLVRLAVSEMGGLILPYTTGMFLSPDNGRPVHVGLAGAADTFCCYRGRFFAIEIKLGTDPWRADQRKFQRAVQDAGGTYVLARFSDNEDGAETVRDALNGVSECPFCGSNFVDHGRRDGSSEGLMFCRECNLGGDFIEPSNNVWSHHDPCPQCYHYSITADLICDNCGTKRESPFPVNRPC